METRKILIADDDSEIREVLRLLLTGEGYQVIEAENGEATLEKLDGSIDLVILDVMMPGTSGYVACAEIRKQSTVPVLFLTAKSQDSDKSMGFSVGGRRLSCQAVFLFRANLPREGHASSILCLRGKNGRAKQHSSLLWKY